MTCIKCGKVRDEWYSAHEVVCITCDQQQAREIHRLDTLWKKELNNVTRLQSVNQQQAEQIRWLKDGLKQILVNAHQESKALVDIARRTLNDFKAVQPQKGLDNEH